MIQLKPGQHLDFLKNSPISLNSKNFHLTSEYNPHHFFIYLSYLTILSYYWEF
jgi:hypothetical protein